MGFSMADVYGFNYGYATTRLQSVPEQNDQEALVDSTTAAADVHTEPVAKRNMIIAMVIVFILLILFSIG